MGWSGHLTHIHIAREAGAPMQPLDCATLIEIETLEALARDHGIVLSPSETRRNLTTRDAPLNHLVGRRFRVVAVLLFGARLNVPCKYLEEVTGKAVYAPLINRSGLNCEILEGGVVRPGDAVRPV